MLGAPSNLLNGPFCPSLKKLNKKFKKLFPLPKSFTPLLLAYAFLPSSASLCVFSSPRARLLLVFAWTPFPFEVGVPNLPFLLLCTIDVAFRVG